MSEKMDALIIVGKVKSILKDSQKKIKEIEKDTSLENPIMNDVILSTKANAYNEILIQYKKLKKQKEKDKEDA